MQLANLFLIRGLLDSLDEFELRVHHRAQMEAVGLRRVMALCQTFGVAAINKQLELIQQILDEDDRRLKEQVDAETLRDYTNLEDVYNALKSRTQETKAGNYFLSMMQHLLLIREEGPSLVHYYQLIDTLVTDIVLDKQLGRAEQRLGHSVSRIIAQFNESDRYQHLEDELARTHAAALQLRLEKESLEEEVAQGSDGLVGSLKSQVVRLEEKLQVSRNNTSRLQGQLETQKVGYEEQIAQLEAQIMELFRMLKEVGKGVSQIFDNAGAMDRKTLIDTLEKHFQRDKTISILEGRDKRRRRKQNGETADEGSDYSDDDTPTPKRSASGRRRRTSVSKGMSKSSKAARESEAHNGRTSQFMDADDAFVQEQIQQQLAKGAVVSVYA